MVSINYESDEFCFEMLGNTTCFPVMPPIVIPPIDPTPGEEDPSGEITLPDGSVVDATGVLAALVGAKQVAWQGSPWNCLWIARTDGLLVGFTYDKDEDVWAFHRHPRINAAIWSIAVIPAASGGADELWAVWRRVIGGATKHFIERMTPRIVPASPTDKSRYCFLDSSLSYDGAPATIFTGFDHLNGEVVRVWADGADAGEVTIGAVTGGIGFTLPEARSVVHAGYNNASVLISLPLASLRTEKQNIAEITLVFHNTLGGVAGRRFEALETLDFRSVNDPMDATPPLWTGDMAVTLEGLHDGLGVYVVAQVEPGPMTLLAAYPKYVASGE